MRPAFERAQRYVERYFNARVEDAQRGIIQLAGERYILVRAASMSTEFFEMVTGLYRDRGREEAHRVARAFLFDIAHAIGKADAKLFHSKMGVMDPIEKLSAGPIHFAFSGWAYVDILAESRPSPDEDYFLIYDHPYSFEADAWIKNGKHADAPVCIMNSGYSSGWCEESFGVPLVATEIACRATGDAECRFIMAPPDRIREHLERHSPAAAHPDRAANVEVPEFFKRKRLEEELRRYQEQLEELVANRTRELTRANQHLREEMAERERVQIQLRQAQKMELLGTLAGGIAHDFNNLLTSILANVQLAMRYTGHDTKPMGWLRDAQEAAERAGDLTKRMLALGRKQSTTMGPTDINEMLARMVRFLDRSIPEDVTISFEKCPEDLCIRADVSQLEQAIVNLAINARDAMPKGGKLSFSVRVVEVDAERARRVPGAQPGSFVCISVSDTGAGIPVELREQVFEPFFTTKGPGRGTGLGLAMVYACAQAHDGWVSVESEVGKGSTFQILLPRVEMAATEAPSPAEPLPTGIETVLLVDDTDAVLYAGQSILESIGYSVLIARDGMKALKLIDEYKTAIALVITDLVMPGASGRDLLAALRDRGLRVPVILTSGHAVERSTEELVAEGFAEFVPKPFDAAQLARVTRKVLDRTMRRP